ncbi:MAG TPA: LCCL domain-containing protein, partial [Thermoleophilaceae bacterium]
GSGSAGAADGSGWSANATAFRGQNGAQKTFDCPKYGTIGGVWGTDVYTDDSSVCTAAVHAGVISLAGGGTVTIEIRPDAGSYTGTVRNRITSQSYPAYQGAFVIVGATPVDPGVAPATVAAGNEWRASAAPYRPWVGAQYEYNCPPRGTPGALWGTDIYTDDSSVCTAAVHARLITFAKGGQVTIQMVDGQPSYRSSKRNGIKSNPYPAWGGSFLIVGAPGGPDDVDAVATGDVTVNGRPFTSGRLKYGSTIDVTRGTLKMTAKGVGNLLTFGDGANPARFKLNKIVQKAGKRKLTNAELALDGGDFSGCTGAARAAAGPAGKVVRSLWSQGSGRFRTKGKYASAAVRGTKWQTTDQCDGTLTTVTEGSVVVRDIPLKKNVVVSAGASYLAKSP